MVAKMCLGCGKSVSDKINSFGVATICENCSFPIEKVPERCSRENVCPNCRGQTNLIGALVLRKLPKPYPVVLYFDCPNPKCEKRRMTIARSGLAVRE